MTYQIYTTINIKASLETIWQILMDTESYSDWNPFIEKTSGAFSKGKMLEVVLTPPESKKMTFKPIVTELIVNQSLHWKGKLWVTGIFDGEHCFELEKISESETRFHHFENFNGLMVPFLKGMLNDNTRRGFEALNLAMKERAESATK